MRLRGLHLHARRAVRRSGGACGVLGRVLASALCSVLRAAMAGWLAALGRRIYRERSKENQIKPELLNRGLFSFCHGKARRRRRRCPWFNPGICNSSQQLHKATKNNFAGASCTGGARPPCSCLTSPSPLTAIKPRRRELGWHKTQDNTKKKEAPGEHRRGVSTHALRPARASGL